MKWKQALLLSIPIGLAAFFIVTARAVVAADGPSEILYGFPLFWIKAGPTSLNVVIDIAAAGIDIVCYQILTGVIARAAVGKWPRVANSVATRIGSWLVGLAVVIACVVLLSFDPSRGGVTFNPAFRLKDIQKYTPYIGVPGSR